MQSGRIVSMFCAAALAASFCANAQTNVYRWVDKDGKVHFSDAPPPADVKEATQKRMGGGGVAGAQLPYATQQAMRRNPVTLFTSNNCGELCANGRALLAKRGIPYTERNAEANPADAEQVKKLIGSLEVPVLLVGEKSVKGYSEGSWQAALDSAGYAKTLLPGQAAAVPPPVPAPAPQPQAAATPDAAAKADDAAAASAAPAPAR